MALTIWAACAPACSVYDAPAAADPPEDAGGGGAESSGGSAGSTDAGGVSAGKAGAIAGGGVGATTTTGGEAHGGVSPTGGAPDPNSGGDPNVGVGGEGGAPPEVDHCPDDPDKLEPGACGCGVPDVATPTRSDCQTLKKKLAHRYDFEGSGTTVTDRVGTAHGSVKGATLSKLDGKGVVLLGGGTTGPYVDLPNKLLSSLTSATLEAWVTWGGGNAWQRIFDFGDSTHSSPENNPAFGKTYLMLTAKSGSGFAAIGFSLVGNANGEEQVTAATSPLPTTLAHVAVVADDTANALVLYVNGAKVKSSAWTDKLSSINDVNCWLGRSQYDSDPELNGVLHEFRIYGSALTDADVATSYSAGPDPAFLSP